MQNETAAAVEADLVLEVRGLKTQFVTRTGVINAVDGVDLSLRRGEMLGLVGEPGAGKSAVGLSVMGLLDEPGRVAAGEIRFAGQDLRNITLERWHVLRAIDMTMMFSDPTARLDPLLRIDVQMAEALRIRLEGGPSTEEAWIRQVLAMAGIADPQACLHAYPHQLSADGRQRVTMAMAFLNQPRLIVADEPAATLDAAEQEQVLRDLRRLCRETGAACLWATRNRDMAASLADRYLVMHAGKVIETSWK